jgi:molybdate-binding protein
VAGQYDNVIVTLADMRQISYCSRGAREFAKRYNLDFNKFITEGIPASELLATKNAMADDAVRAAVKRLGIE